MTTLTLIFTIALIDFLSILSPGQDFAIVTRNTLKYSRPIGYFTVLGIGAVTLFHTLLAMIGLSAVIAQFPEALALIKTIGALYLIYLGTNFVKNARNLSPEKAKPNDKKSVSSTQAFKMGAITNLFNIEPLVAFVSVFAIVLPPETALWIKLVICVLLPLNTMLYLALVTRLFSLHRVQLFLQNHLKTCEQIIGVMLIFFGSKNLMSIRNDS